MSKFTKINIENWNRKEHFHFFNQFEEPIYGITAELDVSIAYEESKKIKTSFYLYYLYKVLSVVNQIDVLRYRIQGGDIIIFDTINASATVNRDDGTFGFSYIDYDPDFKRFTEYALAEIERIRNSTSLFPKRKGEDVIHFSALPWIKFTSLSHARNFSRKDSVPKISVGKMEVSGVKRTMPISVHVHHALVDGVDIGNFYQKLQELFDQRN